MGVASTMLRPASSVRRAPDADGVKKQFPQSVFLQQMAEFQRRCSIRYIDLQKVNPHEFLYGIAVDDVFHPFTYTEKTMNAAFSFGVNQ